MPPGTTFTDSGLPVLHSDPSAPVSIYLDFQYESRDGEKVLFNPSGDPAIIDANEQEIIALAWAKTAAAYAPFYVDVTTEWPGSEQPFIWAAIYRYPTGAGSGGGARTFKYMDLADYFVNRYDAATGRVSDGLLAQSWCREGSVYGDVIVHEVGHSHGVNGHETADTEGNPMGIQTIPIERGPYTRSGGAIGGWFNFTTEWTYQSNPAGMYYVLDDMKVISSAVIEGIKTYVNPSYAGDGYRPDDYGNTIAGASAMNWNASSSMWKASGVIERWADTDVLSFDWAGGTAWAGVQTAVPFPLLDARFKVTDAAGNIIAESDPAESYQAATRLDNLPAGTYYIHVASNGDYTDLGEYEATVSSSPAAALMPITALTFNGNSLTDSSGAGHNATTATGSALYTTGRDGSAAASFNGSNRLQVYQSGNFTEKGLSPWGRTFSFWFKADSISGTRMLLEDAVAPGYQIYIENGRLKAYAINDEGLSDWRGGITLDAGVTLAAGQWYHVALTHRTTFSEVDGTIAMYLDGEEVARGAAGVTPNTDRFYVGSTSFSGAIDDVRIYSEVVPQFMIAEWANRGDLSQPAPTGAAFAAGATSTHDTVSLTWSAVAGATGYQVLRSDDNQHFALIATASSGALAYEDTSLRSSQQYFYRIAAQGAGAVASVEVITRAGPVRFVQYTKVKNPDAAGDYTWASKADIWGHHCEGIYGIALNFFGPDGWRDTGLRIDESTDGVNFTTVVTLPANESVYYDNGPSHIGLVHGQAYTYRLVPVDDLGPVMDAAVILQTDGLNFTPVAVDDTVTITSGNSINISVLSNDTDWDGDSLSIASFTQGQYGTVAKTGSVLQYTRTSQSATADTFTYTVTDPLGAPAAGTVTVTFASSGAIGIFPGGENIGSPALSGAAGYAQTEYTIVAGGSDIWNTSDQFYFVHRTETGDVEMTVRVDSFDSQNAWGKAGIMFRDGTAANAAFAMVVVRPDNTACFQWRSGAGASAGYNGSLLGDTTTPKYLRLVRSGDSFLAYYSTNGTSWTKIGSTQTITMSSSIEVGLAVTSHDAGSLGTAHFTNVKFVPNAVPNAVNDSLSVAHDTPLVISKAGALLANDTDADGDSLTVDSFTQPASGTLVDNGNGALTYTPNTGFSGNDSFTYTVSDNNGGYAMAIAALAVDAGGVNNAPYVVDPIDDFTIEGTPPTTLKVFLLIGQSNMEGQAYTYDSAATAGWNVPTMQFLLSGTPAANTYLANMPASTFTFKNSLNANWLQPRTDAWGVHYDSANGANRAILPTNNQADIVYGIQPLQPGFGAGTGFGSMIGPELGMGINLANTLDSPVFLFKSDHGGTDLAYDWRPPSSVTQQGFGSVGANYTNTVAKFSAFLNTLDADLANDGMLNTYNNATGYEVCGVVWVQGWNTVHGSDHGDPTHYSVAAKVAAYDQNLVNLIHDIRASDARIPDDVGLVVVESSDQDTSLNAKRAAGVATLNAQIPNSAVFVETNNMIGTDWSGPSYPAFSTGWGYHFNARAENFLEIGWKAGTAVLNTGFVAPDILTSQIDLSGVFDDIEDPVLTLSISGNTNAGLVSTSIVNSILTLTYAPGMTGQATITVRATDSGSLYAEDSFTVTVIPPNAAPTVNTPIADVNVNEDAPDTVLDLTGVFVDDVDPTLPLTVTGNTNNGLVTASLNGNSLTLHYAGNASGSGQITIRATDSRGLYAEDTFTVAVSPVNDAPTLVSPITDVTVDEDASATVISLAGVFSDIDDVTLTYSAPGNTNSSLVTASAGSGSLTLTYLPNAYGTAQITVRAADSGGLYVEDTFTVIVNPVPDAPAVVKPVRGVNVDAGYPDTVIDVSGVFADPDGPTPTVTVIANTNPGLVGASMVGANLTLSIPASSVGAAQITLRATDAGGLFVEDTFTVKVGPYIDSTGLVTRYTFDNGTAADTAPNGSVDDSGVLTNGASVVIDPARGNVLSLDGANDLVAVPSSTDIDNRTVAQRTVALWFKADSTSNIRILYEEGGNAATGGMNIYLFYGLLCVHTYGGTEVFISKAIADDHQWHHVAMVLDSTAGWLIGYLDGAPFGYNTGLSVAPHSNGTGIGRVSGAGEVYMGVNLTEASASAFGGLIDDVRIYNRAMNYAEVATLAGRPSLIAPVADVAVNWTAADQVIDLAGVFSGAGSSPLVLTVVSNTNPGAVGSSINGTGLTLDYTPFVSGSTTITIRGTADTGYYAEDTFTVTVSAVVDATAPVITQVTPAGAAAGAILAPLDHIVLKFDDAMYSVDAVAAANYKLAGPGADGVLGTPDDVAISVTPSYSAASHEVTLTAPGTLAHGQYRLTVYGQSGHGLRNEAGLLLDGDSDGSPGGNRVMDFAVSSPGDADLNGVVDASDYITVKRNFGLVGAGFSAGDFDGSGTVDFGDLMLLVANMGNTVVAPPAPAAAAPAVTEEPPAAAAGADESSPADTPAAPAGVVALGVPALPDKFAPAAQAAAMVTGEELIPRPIVPVAILAGGATGRTAPSARFDALGAARHPGPLAKPARARCMALPARVDLSKPFDPASISVWDIGALEMPDLDPLAASPLGRPLLRILR